ncbi:MAG: glycosyltransferase family 2 protein [Acidobacteriota bacterium]
MTAPPLLSVVIPSYNYARFLDDCLRSIYAQENAPEFEVIVVDDGSTDGTLERLDAWRRPNLRVVARRHNLGHAATINEALPLARGAVIARLDPDDRYRPHFMATVVETLEAHPAVGLVFANAAIIDDAGTDTGHVTPRPHSSDFHGSEFLALLDRNFICAPTVAARRQVWLDSLPVPEHLAFHDWYFTLLASRRHDFAYVDEVIAEYRVHGANHHSSISRDGSEERSVLWLLDKVYAEMEPDPGVEAAKQRRRRRVYASHYLDFAEKYFWFRRQADARRCYASAAWYWPARLLDGGVMRRFAGSLINRRLYDWLKTGHTRVLGATRSEAR